MNVLPDHRVIFKGNRGLIVQFILHELFAADLLFKEMYMLWGEEDFSSLFERVGSLSGHASKSTHLFTNDVNAGILSKLKNYSAYFSLDKDAKESGMELRKISHRLCATSSALYDDLKEFSYTDFKLKSLKKKIDKSLQKMDQDFTHYCDTLCLVLETFNQNENVVWYLVKHRKKADAIFKEERVKALFERYFPQGNIELRDFLIQRYSERGFYSLLPLIEAEVKNL